MKLILNQIQTPDGTILRSVHENDYQSHIDRITGEKYFVDGGLFFPVRSTNEVEATEMSLFNDEPHQVIRQYVAWGTHGKSGLEALRWVVIKDLSDEHIDAILRTQTQISPTMKQYLMDEQAFRKNIPVTH